MVLMHNTKATNENGGNVKGLTPSSSPSLSERLTATMSPAGTLSERQSDLPEQWRLASEDWIELDGAARLLEENKKIVFSQIMSEWPDIPVNKAEHKARRDPRYTELIENMVQARTKANIYRVRAEYMRMKFEDNRTREVTRRAEMNIR
tara:strand:- start:1206 stop:1652 length:447 start_codon:yes stop_codon:yes gene_type:complete